MSGWLGVAIVVGVALLIFLSLRSKPKTADAKPQAAADPFDNKIADIVQTYDDKPATDPGAGAGEARFQEIAAQQLEPLLRGVVEQAAAGGHKANLERNIETGAARYRLEIRRTDHLPNEPLPYILFHAGEKKDVAVLIGGTFPGRKAENSHRTEIDWYEVAWKDVDEELVKFTRKVFHHFTD